ncbi:MAG TPA: VWA domain-containing protein, partial [Anaerolineales bacterium]|nr:VWA domain-containing protein [Anaerolineales bacterium]
MRSEPPPEKNILLANLLHFGRLLRLTGIPVSSIQIIDLARAFEFLDLARKEDVYQASRSILVKNVTQFGLFDRAFRLFWLHYQEWLVDFNQVVRPVRSQPGEDGLAESDQTTLGSLQHSPAEPDQGSQDRPADSSIQGTYNALEILREKDFAFLTQEELETARQAIQNLIFEFEQRSTRRKVRAPKRAEYLDFRRVLRQNLKTGGEILQLSWSERQEKPRPIIVLCDISGSMERYSQLFLHFMVALVQEKRQIETFVFGTRLTYITPALRYRDLDAVIRQMAGVVMDWSGGTRIGESLKEFNFKWSRRMLRRGAVVIIISDGWDRGDAHQLEQEIARLRRSV